MYGNQVYPSMGYTDQFVSAPGTSYSNYSVQTIPQQIDERVIMPQGLSGGQPMGMGAQYYPLPQQAYQPMGQPNFPMNQPYQPMGQPNFPMNQPYQPMGQPNFPMNQPYQPMGQPNFPMNQPYQPMGQPNFPMNQPYQPMGQPNFPMMSGYPIQQ